MRQIIFDHSQQNEFFPSPGLGVKISLKLHGYCLARFFFLTKKKARGISLLQRHGLFSYSNMQGKSICWRPLSHLGQFWNR